MTKSVLTEEKEEIKNPEYSPEEELYIGELRQRMETARNDRDKQHPEFDGLDYVTNYELDERWANTQLQAKKNKEDTTYQSGTVRQKLFALLSALLNLDLSGDISAFNKDGLEIQGLGDGMEDVILKTKELDNDDEKKYLREYELLKHGTVFVEELWTERQKKVKKLSGKFDGKLAVKWNTRIKKAFARPTRNIIPGTNVYLGDITKYDISEQPYIFTVDSMPYDEAKSVFGEWERWECVPRKFTNSAVTSQIAHWWTLNEKKDDYVEIIRYQDKWNNEFSIKLNGILMTPVGLPLPWGYEDYNIAQQNLEPIHTKFAYGKSAVSRIRNKVALLDEMERLAILKTQKSYMPPRYNISGRIVSNRVFMPGKINYGIQPGTLPPIEGENVGVTTSEFQMIEHIRGAIDTDTVSPVFQGQKSAGDPTATEIIELQRQAKMIMGLIVFAASMLEWKLEWLRLQNVLAHWFEPEDNVVDEARGMLKEKYRNVSVDRPIDGEGMGRRMVIPTKEMPSPMAIKTTEDALSQEQGVPIRIIFLNPDEVTSAKLIWQIVVRPKEKRNSETDKLMFRAFMADVIPLGPDPGYIRERVATVWGENPKKLFPMGNQPMPMGQDQSQTLSPRVNLPSPEQAANRNISNTLKT